MTDERLAARVRFLKHLGIVALCGLVVLVLTTVVPEGTARTAAMVLGVLAVVPAFFYLVLLVQWHWKARYRGTHSDLWGGILLLETSGWFKLVYLLRHVLPDIEGRGRDARPAART